MHSRLARLRQELQQYQQPDRPRSARYPAALRQEIGRLAQDAHASGTSFAAFARSLGVTPTLVLRARLPRDERSSVLRCPRCGGGRRIAGVYSGGPRLRDVLARLGLGDHSSRPPPEPGEWPIPRRPPSPDPGPRPSSAHPGARGLDGPG